MTLKTPTAAQASRAESLTNSVSSDGSLVRWATRRRDGLSVRRYEVCPLDDFLRNP